MEQDYPIESSAVNTFFGIFKGLRARYRFPMPPKERASQIAHRQRTVLLELLPRVEAAVGQGIPASRFLRREFLRHRYLGARDRRFLSNAIFSWFRWKGWIAATPECSPAQALAAAFRLDDPLGHPALDADPVPAPSSLPDPWNDPVGFLTAKGREWALRTGHANPPPPESLLPPETLPLFDLPAGDPHARTRLLAAFQIRPPVWIRVRAGFEHRLEAEASRLGLSFYKDSRLPQAWALPPEGDRLRLLVSHLPGLFEIQDIASQLVGLAADPHPGEYWWDLCAGAGGKTLHLADLAFGQIHLLATEIRLSALREAERRAALSPYRSAIRFENRDVLESSPPDAHFDGVLLDAPCSGSGVWGREPDARWRFRLDRWHDLLKRQEALLETAARAVRPGGRLIYATCSLFRSENHQAITRFLDRHPEFSLAPFAHPFTGLPVNGTLTVWPWEGPGDGFFIARLRRQPRD